MPTITRLFLVCALLTPLVACDKVDEAFDCRAICKELKTCVVTDLDVDECADRCFDTVEEDDALADQADQCEECIDDNSCRDITTQCKVCDDVLMEFTGERFGSAKPADDEDAGTD